MSWKKLSDEMPKQNKPVLIFYESQFWKNPAMAVGINFDGDHLRCLNGGAEILGATHWQELPDAPVAV